jgi:hypothetical protein
MKGGHVWHLTMECTCSKAVLIGPTNEVPDHGHIMLSSDGEDYWDDKLTEEELAFICRVYKVYTGMFHIICLMP